MRRPGLDREEAEQLELAIASGASTPPESVSARPRAAGLSPQGGVPAPGLGAVGGPAQGDALR